MESNLPKTQGMAQPGQYLTFTVGTETYGIPVATVREINQVTDITSVPQTPPFMEGVMNLRGKVIPVISLRMKLGLPREAYTKQTCIVMIEGQDGIVGVVVDSVKAVITIAVDQIEPSPLWDEGQKLDFILGLANLKEEVLILIDVAQTLGSSNFLSKTG